MSRKMCAVLCIFAALSTGFARASGAVVPKAGVVLPPANVSYPPLAELEEGYVSELFRDEPAFATNTGVHAYDDRLADYSAAGYAHRIERSKRYLAQVQRMQMLRIALPPEDVADMTVMRLALESELQRDETEERYKHDPSSYTSASSYAIYSLFSRNFAPLPVRMRSAIARMEAIPAVLAAGQANTTTVDATTAQIAARIIEGAQTFFRDTVPAAFASVEDSALQAHLKTADAAVVAAIAGYRTALAAGPFAHPSGTYAIGAENFARRLAVQEGREISLVEYERVGSAALEETKNQFIATAKQIDATKNAADVYARLGGDHPAAATLISTAQGEIAGLKTFVQEKALVTLPPEFDVRVVETPIFSRQTSFASMNTPGAFEKVATQAYYNVTPVDAQWSPAQQEQHLAFFNNYAFPIITAHEVMPGHYLNFVKHKFERLSLVRAISGNASYTEGWAHYCEQMIVDQGWGGGDPKVRLAQLALALQREARYLVGLREHTQGMSVDQATLFFRENAFMPEVAARREALRGTEDPLYGYYTLGKLEILKLRDDYHKVKGTQFTLKGFHDEFLAHGNPPIAVVRKLMLGDADDGKLL